MDGPQIKDVEHKLVGFDCPPLGKFDRDAADGFLGSPALGNEARTKKREEKRFSIYGLHGQSPLKARDGCVACALLALFAQPKSLLFISSQMPSFVRRLLTTSLVPTRPSMSAGTLIRK